jgi:hypothetical protein
MQWLISTRFPCSLSRFATAFAIGDAPVESQDPSKQGAGSPPLGVDSPKFGRVSIRSFLRE